MLALVAALLALNTALVDRERQSASADIGHVLRLPAGDLHIREDGRRGAPAVVLLHGLAGSLHQWSRVVPRLARRFRIVRIDLLGHGGSDKPRHGYRPDDQAALLAAALDELDVNRATIVGQSLGGMVAVALAEKHPHLAHRLLIFSTQPEQRFLHFPLTARLASWPVIGELSHRFATDGSIRDTLSHSFSDGVRVPDRFIDDVRRMTFTAYRTTMAEAEAYTSERPLQQRAQRLPVQVKVILAEDDALVDPGAADAWRQADNTLVRLVPGGHSPYWERPGFVARLIAGFGSTAPSQSGRSARESDLEAHHAPGDRSRAAR